MVISKNVHQRLVTVCRASAGLTRQNVGSARPCQTPLVKISHDRTLSQPDMVLYNAGTDILDADPLGHMRVSAEGVAARDEVVFEVGPVAAPKREPRCTTGA